MVPLNRAAPQWEGAEKSCLAGCGCGLLADGCTQFGTPILGCYSLQVQAHESTFASHLRQDLEDDVRIHMLCDPADAL
jgi:hypothetical protein